MGHSARMAEMQRFPDNGRERDTSAHLHAIPSNTDSASPPAAAERGWSEAVSSRKLAKRRAREPANVGPTTSAADPAA